MFFAPSKSRKRAKIWIMGMSKTSGHIQIEIKMPNPSQAHPASSKDPHKDINNMDVLCTFKIKIERQIWIMVVSKTSNHIQIKIKMPNPSQAHPASSKDPHQDINNMDVLCTFKITKENQNLDQTYLKIYELNYSDERVLCSAPQTCLANCIYKRQNLRKILSIGELRT